ncbi:MAG: cutinase family protein [Propionicimonas sp.]
MSRPWKCGRALVALLVTILSLAVTTTPASASSTPTRIRQYAEACQDVLFVGARGSGNGFDEYYGLGEKVHGLMRAYAARLDGRRLGYFAIPYPAQPVKALVYPSTRKQYFEGIDTGVEQTLTALKVRQSRCPNERSVLVGYSQGAMVMHRVMWQLAARADGFAKIDGIIAIADGDRVPGQGGWRYGTSPTTSIDKGVSFLVSNLAGIVHKPQWRVTPASVRSRFLSICDSGDLVCDFPRANGGGVAGLLSGSKTHTSHYGPSASSVISAAARVAAVTNSHPVVRPAPAPAPTVQRTGKVLASPCLNFRSGPGAANPLIGCIPLATIIPVQCTAQGNAVTGPYGTETIWDRTIYGGKTGFVSDAWVYTGSNNAVVPSC